MNKKASFEDFGTWIVVLIVLSVVMLTIFGIVNAFVNAQTETGDLNLYLIEKRILQNPNCLAYEETDNESKPLKTIYGAVDKSKFKEPFLEGCLSIKNQVGVLVEFEGKEYYFDKNYYDEIRPLSRFDGYKIFESKRLVTVFDGSIKKEGVITFTLVDKK